jgi:transposase InsO family protein
VPESAANLRLMQLLDQEYTAHPFLGSRRLTKWLQGQGEEVDRKRVQRLMRLMGLEAIYPKPKLSAAGRGHRIYPYLLRNVRIERPDQVWSTDITYVPLPCGFMYLAAIIDWFSRHVLAWRLSNTLDGSFCLEMLEEALSRGRPEVFNTDQGVQFTATAWTGWLEGGSGEASRCWREDRGGGALARRCRDEARGASRPASLRGPDWLRGAAVARDGVAWPRPERGADRGSAEPGRSPLRPRRAVYRFAGALLVRTARTDGDARGGRRPSRLARFRGMGADSRWRQGDLGSCPWDL